MKKGSEARAYRIKELRGWLPSNRALPYLLGVCNAITLPNFYIYLKGSYRRRVTKVSTVTYLGKPFVTDETEAHFPYHPSVSCHPLLNLLLRI